MKIYNTGAGLLCFYTPADLARAFGVKPQRINQRIHVDRTLPAPSHLNGKRFYYTAEEFKLILDNEAKRLELLGR